MIKAEMAVVSATLFVTAISLALIGWRNRTKRQQKLFTEPLEALDYFGEQLCISKAFYVATTLASNHLDRITAYGLGHRGQATVFVFTEGLLIVREGERPLAIAREQLSDVFRTNVAIDKAVERDGLISIEWVQGNADLVTHIRIVDSKSAQEILSKTAKLVLKEVKN